MGIWRHLFGLQIMAVTVLAVTVTWAQPQDATRPPIPAANAEAKAALDEIEAALGREELGTDELAALRGKLNATADQLRANIEDIEPRAREAEERLKQLGPAPAKDAPPETAEIARERAELTTSFGQLDGALKEARVLAVRSDQLSERIAQRRHMLYARELFARSASALDPSLWSDAARALRIELARAQALIAGWRADRADARRLTAAGVGFALVLAIAIGASRWWLPRLVHRPCDTGAAKAWTALALFAFITVRTSFAALAALAIADALGLLTARIEQIAHGIVAALAAAAFGNGVARGLFAVERPQRRLMAEDDATARTFHNHLVWASRLLGIAIALQVLHKTLFAPLAVTIATNALFAAAVAAFLAHLGWRLRRLKDLAGGGLVAATWIHPLALLFAILIALALAAGYTAFAAFLALRVIVAGAVFGALYLLTAATHALFAGIGEDTARGRRLAASLGLTPRTLGIAGALVSAAIRVLLIVLAFVLIIGPWEVSTADLFDTVRNVPFGFKIGEVHLSVRTVIIAAVALALVLILTRLAQRWLESELLPRTTIEPSLQLSIVTILGYLGVIAAIALAAAELGFDPQKIALIAGALSVGIGFGLQSIVSNFVSGLILLTERPIRVGDAIVVKGEEGLVRRVRVRATEIETYDRASVIIPNSELISGVVRNWTRTDRTGTVVIKVAAAYGSDAAKVRELLLDVARAHPQVLAAPPPGAFLAGFGESALEFELRCVVADRSQGLAVRSDLNCEILRRFRTAAIEMPYPQRELRWRDGVGLQPKPK
jgi:potassium efflux system protein